MGRIEKDKVFFEGCELVVGFDLLEQCVCTGGVGFGSCEVFFFLVNLRQFQKDFAPAFCGQPVDGNLGDLFVVEENFFAIADFAVGGGCFEKYPGS